MRRLFRRPFNLMCISMLLAANAWAQQSVPLLRSKMTARIVAVPGAVFCCHSLPRHISKLSEGGSNEAFHGIAFSGCHNCFIDCCTSGVRASKSATTPPQRRYSVDSEDGWDDRPDA